MKSIKQGFVVLSLLTLLSPPLRGADEETLPKQTDVETSQEIAKEPRPALHAGLDIQYSATNFPKFSLGPKAPAPKRGQFLHLGLEWLPFNPAFGKLGIGVSLGYFILSGAQVSPGTKTDVSVYPLGGYLSYRFDYFQHQLFVPFGKAGVTGYWLNQSGVPGTERFNALDIGGGLELCLNKIDWEAYRSLERSTGIHGTYFVLEYDNTSALGKIATIDLSHDEIRAGLRFEL